jgi:small-conductance mechanosensitive channel
MDDLWQPVEDWLASLRLAEGGFWSGLCLLLIVAIYLLFRRRIHAHAAEQAIVRTRRRMLQFALGVVFLLSLMRIWLQEPFGSIIAKPQSGQNILESLLWTLVAAVAIYILVRGVQRHWLRYETEIEARHRARQLTSWAGILGFVVVLFFIWASQVRDLGVFLGIIGAGLALSMGETLLCIAGWAVLIVKRPFDIGDRVELDGRIGDVIGYSLFHTSLLEVGNWVHADQSTGRMLVVPNSMIIRHALYNYTKGFPFLWDEFSTVVTFESDWEAAKQIMQAEADEETDKIENEVRKHLTEMQRRYAIRYVHLRPIVYTGIADHGVLLTLRYLTPVRQRRATTHRISEDILRKLIEHPRVDFAYPTTRIFRNNEEGKVALGGPADKPAPSGPHAIG